MSRITFVTSNCHKVDELRQVFPAMVQADIDLPEVQAVDSRDVVAAKLAEARSRLPIGAIIVEDTALHLACLNGFPGALIKWLLASVRCKGVYDLCHGLGNFEAEARTVLGYLPEHTATPMFFDACLRGRICPPKGNHGFGWDPIFEPEGTEKTLAELLDAERHAVKMRRRAAEKLANYLSLSESSGNR
jgi:inosine triphosphate pyrophosphatase